MATGQVRRAQAAPQGEEEHRAGPRPHQVDVQQHDRLDHRPVGRCHQLGLVGWRGLQGLAQVDPVRRRHGRRVGCPPGAGARRQEGRRLREGPGLGPRDRDPFAAGRRPRGRLDPGRDAAGAQRLPPAQAPPRLTPVRAPRRSARSRAVRGRRAVRWTSDAAASASHEKNSTPHPLHVSYSGHVIERNT